MNLEQFQQAVENELGPLSPEQYALLVRLYATKCSVGMAVLALKPERQTPMKWKSW